tara:strand:- start:2009 stop:2560 length:552 start_codon:yes stop_codon:yes gene_type:complete
MACNLTAGRKEPCKDVVGGIRKVYFTDFGGYGTVTQSNDDEITDMSGTFTAFEYELKGTSSFEQTITSSRENGTTFFEQTLNITLKKLTKEDNKELKLLAYGRPHVAVEDYNGNVFVMGLEHGADVSGGTIVTGSGLGELSGYTLTLTSQEVLPANFVSAPTAANPFGGMSSATVTVTEGTNS